MILNDKERAELITALKNQYDERQNIIKHDEFPFYIESEEQKEKFIYDTEELQEYIETIEKQEKIEISLDQFKSNNDDYWFGILGLIAFMALFGGGFNGGENPYNNSTLN